MSRSCIGVYALTIKKAEELGIKIEFNRNPIIAPKGQKYVNHCYINGRLACKGMQSWGDEVWLDGLIPALQEVADGNLKVEDVDYFCMPTKTKSTLKNGHVEYAKGSYRWSQIELIDRFNKLIEIDLKIDCKSDDLKSIYNSRKDFMIESLKKSIKCCPNMNGWSSDRIGQCYLTNKILPKMIREELMLEVSNQAITSMKNEFERLGVDKFFKDLSNTWVKGV